jgi:hypothetical protein
MSLINHYTIYSRKKIDSLCMVNERPCNVVITTASSSSLRYARRFSHQRVKVLFVMARINGGQLDQIEIAIEDFERIRITLNGLGVVCVLGVLGRYSFFHFVHLDEKGTGRLDRGWG